MTESTKTTGVKRPIHFHRLIWDLVKSEIRNGKTGDKLGHVDEIPFESLTCDFLDIAVADEKSAEGLGHSFGLPNCLSPCVNFEVVILADEKGVE